MMINSIKQPEKILYYLGAGASANVLPLARSIWNEVEDTRGNRAFWGGQKNATPKIPGLAFELEQPLLTYIPDCVDEIYAIRSEWKILAEKANEFGDVDTYAKYLQLIDPNGVQLDKLKHTLSTYFSIKQTIDGALDRRYLPWLISIMNRKAFPENVRILSWNYDSQVQLAIKQLGDDEKIEMRSGNRVYTPSMIKSYPNLDFQSMSGDLSLIHLNGRAGFSALESGFESIFQPSNCASHSDVMKYISEKRLETGLHFAWENGDYHQKLMQKVTDMIYETTIVVVIGYSFPFFNREVDKDIFTTLKMNRKLKKIYFQDPVLDGQQLRAQFGLEENIPIVHIKQTDNFHVPFEY